MEIQLTIEEFEAIKSYQGWTDEEAQRWLDDKEPLPDVRWPPMEIENGSKQKL